MWQLAIGGLTLGFLGSLHCAGMCGPLVFALPVYHLNAAKRLFAMLLYNAGRVFTYASIGLVFGLAGRGLYLSGLQQWVSITLGVIILVFFLLSYAKQSPLQFPLLQKMYTFVQQAILRVLRSPAGLPSYLWLGMLNGLLPCGMVYIALATALTFAATSDTVVFMSLFGAGTIPAMIAVSYMGISMNGLVRQLFKKVLPYSMAVVAVLLILRGLHLGIPFVSPVLPHNPGEGVNCHP